MPEPAFERDALYQQGFQALRTAQWQEAIDAFTAIQQHNGNDAEIDKLIASAQLKLDIDRAQGAIIDQPKRPRRRLIPLVMALVGLLCFSGGAVFWLVQAPQQAPVQASAALAITTPTTAATEVPTPTTVVATQLPQPTVAATAAPQPTVAATLMPTPTTGVLQVAWANNTPANRVQRIEIILDASGSMLGKIDGQRKIDIAHKALSELVTGLPDNAEVALRTYGRQRSNDCQDVELVQPLSKLDRSALIGQITNIIPVAESRTPLALSLQQTADDLRNIDGSAMIILVSDGDETCGGDPAAVAAKLRAERPELRISVIGFNVGPEEWRTRLRTTADNGGGSYFDAANAAQLATALQNAAASNLIIRSAANNQSLRGQIGQAFDLSPGRYSIMVDGFGSSLNDIEVNAGQTTTVNIQEQAGVLLADPAQPAGTKQRTSP